MISESYQGGSEETRAFRMLSQGTIISHYKIVEKIGEGGMGVVYKAIDTKLDRPVALKFLPPRLLCDAEARARFEHEAKSASAISHANITTVHEIDEAEGRCFISMEYIEGNSMKDLSEGKPLSVEEILGVAIQIGGGLKAAHQKGVVHRDIKSANILVSSDGVVKITDFGLAKLRGTTKLTKTGTTLGTLHYMSPEQAQGKDVDARSDLFSFGVVLYEVITGRLPFKGEYEQAVVYSILNDAPEPLARYKSGLPEGLQRIVDKALAKDRDERYQDAADILADLKREKKLLEAGGAVGVPPSAGRKMMTRVLRVLIPAAVVVVAVLVLFVLKPFRVGMGPGEEAAARENSLAIMYFENLADRDDPDKLGEIVTSLLITDLSESRYLSVVSSQRLYDLLKLVGRKGIKVVDREVASEVAARARARWMLLGSILQMEPHVIVTAQLVEVESGRVKASQRVMGEAGEQIFTIVDRLTAEVRSDLALPAAAQDEMDRPIADVTTHSPEAYQSYLEGMNYYYDYSWTEAEQSFEKALEFDSTFAMAYYGLALSTSDVERTRETLEKAVKYSDRVSHKEQYYIRALVATSSGDYERGVEEFEDLLKRYPDEKAAMERLAELLEGLHRFDEAIEHLERIIEIDPLYKEAYNYLAYDYLRIGNYDRSVWAAEKYVALAPEEHNPYDTRGDIYALSGRLDEAIRSYSKALDIRPDFYPALAYLGHVYLVKREYALAESCYREVCTNPSGIARSEGRWRLAAVPAYQGKLEEALETLDAGIAADRMERSEYWLAEKHLAKSDIYIERNETDKALAEYMEAEAIIRRRWPERAMNWTNDYVGVLVANGEIEKAEGVVAAARAHLEAEGEFPKAYYWLSLSMIERAKGNFADALSNLERTSTEIPYLKGRFLLARAYFEANRLGETVAELEMMISNFNESRVDKPIWTVKAHYLLALAYEQSGWNSKAIEQYEEFLEIWKNADPGIPEVDDARQRLARLQHAP